ncbi:biotin transporter BioY [Anaerovorax sp. IOR16]|uniref:biotin transporter BioY n=1 Tax=Anaerovorax sp. IOR16 TaxID=2773458 RepID=UPI0019D1605C|nr:biotin transporter BioY [Anaerovorax sp. IOR16]
MTLKRKIRSKELVLCSLFSALIAVGAFIQIPVPFMDYFTLQFLFVLLAGMILGSKMGMISVAVYVAAGLVGFPIFAAGGGISYVFRPSFGYLIGFIVAAFIVGLLCEKVDTLTFRYSLYSALVGMVTTYMIGFIYKYAILNYYMGEVTPFSIILLSAFPLDIPGDTVLCIIAASLARRIIFALKKENLKWR